MAELYGSPLWWVQRLSKALDLRCKNIDYLEAYYEGRHPLPEPNPGSFQAAVSTARRAWEKLAAAGITNWVALVADAPAERLEVSGFQFGEPKRGSLDDAKAWRIWQGNNLDADSGLVFSTALQVRQAFMSVWPNPKSPVGVDIFTEHPSQVIVAYQAGSRRKRAAALKRYSDDEGYLHAILHLPDFVYKFRSATPLKTASTSGKIMPSSLRSGFTWLPREDPGERWPLPNPFGEVAIVEFAANPTLKPSEFGGGRSEFDGVLSIQDRINKTVFDRMVTAEHQAFRQRYVIGWDFPTVDDGHGNQRPDRAAMLEAGASKLWAFNPADGDGSKVQVGEMGQADFTSFVNAVEADVHAMAAISKTPPHYLLGTVSHVSGDTIKATEAGLIKKVGRHARNFGESIEEVMRLALRAVGDKRGDDVQSMTIWADPELRTWGETVDAIAKMGGLDNPPDPDWLLSLLPGVTPQMVARWTKAREADAYRLVEAVASLSTAMGTGLVSGEEARAILNKLGAELTGSAPPLPVAPPPKPAAGATPPAKPKPKP